MSDWKAGAVKYRDARHTKGPDGHRPVAGKKDTKKWCRGKVGVKHELKCMPWSTLTTGRVLACVNCGKHLDYYLPWPTQTPKPAWVDS
jgi:hypothetical protein